MAVGLQIKNQCGCCSGSYCLIKWTAVWVCDANLVAKGYWDNLVDGLDSNINTCHNPPFPGLDTLACRATVGKPCITLDEFKAVKCYAYWHNTCTCATGCGDSVPQCPPGDPQCPNGESRCYGGRIPRGGAWMVEDNPDGGPCTYVCYTLLKSCHEESTVPTDTDCRAVIVDDCNHSSSETVHTLMTPDAFWYPYEENIPPDSAVAYGLIGILTPKMPSTPCWIDGVLLAGMPYYCDCCTPPKPQLMVTISWPTPTPAGVAAMTGYYKCPWDGNPPDTCRDGGPVCQPDPAGAAVTEYITAFGHYFKNGDSRPVCPGYYRCAQTTRTISWGGGWKTTQQDCFETWKIDYNDLNRGWYVNITLKGHARSNKSNGVPVFHHRYMSALGGIPDNVQRGWLRARTGYHNSANWCGGTFNPYLVTCPMGAPSSGCVEFADGLRMAWHKDEGTWGGCGNRS